MDKASYDYMEVDKVYGSYYLLGGSCIIKKTAECIDKGQVIATYPDGSVRKTHYSMLSLIERSE